MTFLNYLIVPHDIDDIIEISNFVSKQVIEDCITSNENLASDRTTYVVEVTSNDVSLSANNLSFASNSAKVVIEDNVDVSGLNKDLDRSSISVTYSSSIEVCHQTRLSNHLSD